MIKRSCDKNQYSNLSSEDFEKSVFNCLLYFRKNQVVGLEQLVQETAFRKLEFNEVDPYLEERLRNVGFKLSTSQRKTPADGNCFVHSIKDQLR